MTSTPSPETVRRWNHYFHHRNVNLNFPGEIQSLDEKKALRTKNQLIQLRLIDAGVDFGTPSPMFQTHMKLERFINQLIASGCYDIVNAEIDQLSPSSSAKTPQQKQQQQQQQEGEKVKVFLKEKNWYKLYVGGNIRNDIQAELGGGSSMGMDVLGKTQFETSAGLRNLTGYLDTTDLQYTVDATGQSRWNFAHIRPLDGIFLPLGVYDTPNVLTDLIKNPGQYSLGIRAALDTLDYEWTRSYRERQRKLSVRLSNYGQVPIPEMANSSSSNNTNAGQPYVGLEWSWIFRDIIPRRHPTMPYALDASPEIVSQSGPSEKNSIELEYRTNGCYCDNRFNPEEGIDYYAKMEMAGPPGDVGFVKAQGGGSIHAPISLLRSSSSSSSSSADRDHFHFTLHGSFHSGILHPLTFGGVCRPPTVSDRFYVGGPLQLRGFCPAGIGPRAKPATTTTTAAPQGDALGGEFFYTATLAASTTTEFLAKYGLRLLVFGNAGTLAGCTPLSSSLSSSTTTAATTTTPSPSWQTIANSSRASVGVGICGGLPLGRVEATYSIPLRYGPRDMRKNVQFGLGFSFG